MALLGLLFREGKERAQDYAARKELEAKLGRRVTHEELYSIGSHIEAAGTIESSKPLTYTPREASTPFAEAKPPMSFKLKLLLLGIPFSLLFVFVAGFALYLMQDSIKNYMNPPPVGTYPQTIGEYNLSKLPYYNAPTSYDSTTRYSGEYKRGAETVQYRLTIYNSEADATAAYNKIKDSASDGERRKVVEKSDNRVAIAALSGWNSYVYFKDGKYLKTIDSFSQKSALDFEGFLKNTEPLPVTPINEAALKQNALNAGTLTVLQLLDEFKKDSPAADKKYKGKNITVSGTVEVSDKDKKGNPMIGFMRPGSTKPTDGMVVCGFDKSKAESVSVVKKGDQVKLSGNYSMSLVGTVLLENCTKL